MFVIRGKRIVHPIFRPRTVRYFVELHKFPVSVVFWIGPEVVADGG